MFPALIPSPRGLASVARQFRSITDSVLSPSEGPSLPSLWAPSCIRHIPGYPGVLLVACGAQLHFWHFRKFREQRTEAYNHGLGLATWGCLGLFGREPHPASPWGPGEDLAWRSLPRRTSLVFSSFHGLSASLKFSLCFLPFCLSNIPWLYFYKGIHYWVQGPLDNIG